jgi:hypothetical protein
VGCNRSSARTNNQLGNDWQATTQLAATPLLVALIFPTVNPRRVGRSSESSLATFRGARQPDNRLLPQFLDATTQDLIDLNSAIRLSKFLFREL